MKKMIVCVAIVMVAFAGCAWIEQFGQDVQTSKATPYSPGETTVEERAARYVQPLAGLPWGAGTFAVPVGGFLIAYVLHKLRGRKIRTSSLEATESPITGFAGKKMGLETVVQFLSDVTAAIFEVGKDGSLTKRGWKGFLYGAIGTGALAPVVLPYVQQVIEQFPNWFSGATLAVAAGLGSALVAVLEKASSKVLPPPAVNPASPVID